MKNNYHNLILIVALVLGSISVLIAVHFQETPQEAAMISKAYEVDSICSLFSVTAEDITKNVDVYIEEAQNTLNKIISLPNDERNFFNTVKAIDELFALSNLAIAQRLYEVLELVSPEKDIRDAAHDAYLKIQRFWSERVSSNKKLYAAFMAYASQQKEYEGLSDEQRYLVNYLAKEFKKEGLFLPDETLNKVTQLRNELSELIADFDRAIAQDNSSIAVTLDELNGLDENFITTLSQNEDGTYKLGVDYPTYFRVMENCSNADTRKKLYHAFNNRAYPSNDELLQTIMTKRDELAQMLEFVDFAAFNIDGQMAQSPERVRAFLTDLKNRVALKVIAEKELLTQQLPESVELSANGTMQPWDFMYLENRYKKEHFNLDEQKIAEYFPMEKAIKELLDIYRQFFNIEFKAVPVQGLWHEDVFAVQVLSKDKTTLLGTLLLDLYPRPNKYSHACHATIVPATYTQDGTRIPDVSLVIANFTKATDEQPSLLKRNEVQTFFHEFGHALHAVLGATTSASLSGTSTKTDFVEMPSQMLEEWLYNKDILKKVSGHYLTGEPLPDDVIDMIIAAKDLTSGYWVLRQVFLATYALSCFERSEDVKDPYELLKNTYETIMSSVVSFAPENHFYASFGHLTGYGAKYYGYLWSKVFALDLFAEIKKHGLLNPVIGQRYIKEVIGKGGSQDPNELLYNFLGREPNAQAFFKEMGI